jgi:peroxiredoxin
MLETGARAPDVRVAIREGEWVQLSDLLAGRPGVVLFFPFAFSGICTEELCAVAEDWAAWSALGAAVVAISVDSPHVSERFAEVTGASFPIVSDFNREAIRAYGVVRSDIAGLKEVAERAVFVIGGDGIVVWTWQGEHPGVLPPLDEVRRIVSERT